MKSSHPWRGPRGEQLRPPANGQHQLAGHVSEPWFKWIFQPLDELPQLTPHGTETNCLHRALSKLQVCGQKQNKAKQEQDCHCFKSLSFGVLFTWQLITNIVMALDVWKPQKSSRGLKVLKCIFNSISQKFSSVLLKMRLIRTDKQTPKQTGYRKSPALPKYISILPHLKTTALPRLFKKNNKINK